MPHEEASGLSAMSPTDTRRFFRPVGNELVELLRGLAPESWDRPTVAGSWLVRDVVAHLADTSLRRLSLQRDEQARGSAGSEPASEREILALVNGLNATWVAVARRFSPRVLTDLYRTAIEDLADFFESLTLDAPALFPVSWAGEQHSEGWFDVAREFTEQWHHQAQIRDAVGAPPLSDPAWLRAVLETAVRGLPHAYRDVSAAPGATVCLKVTGRSGGAWTLRREAGRWTIHEGAVTAPDASLSMTDDAAWRLLFNALSREEAARAVRAEGDAALTSPLLSARSVIV